MANHRFRTTITRTSLYLILLAGTLFSLGPILWVVITSFKPTMLTFAIPPPLIFSPTLSHYSDVLVSEVFIIGFDFWKYMRNSVVVSLASTIFTLIVALPAAYSLARLRFSGKLLIDVLILSIRMLPPIGTIVPLYLFMYSIGLLDTRTSLVLAYTAINIPFGVWMLRGFIEEVPASLEEAAMADGCSRRQALTKILIPLISPGLAATSVFIFFLCWNEYPIALTLTSTNAQTLPLAVKLFHLDEGIAWGPMSAAATLMILPPIAFFLITKKYIAKGLTMGAVKG